MRYRLGRQLRLKRRGDIQHLFAHGTFYRGAALDIIFRAHADRKVLFAVARSVRSKVRRNAIKRRLREIYRLHQSEIPRSGYHLALIGKQQLLSASFPEASDEFLNIVSRMATE